MSPEPVRAEPLHIQIAGHYKRMIMSGEIKPGERLPSVRDVVRQWGVGQNTAQHAVEYLKTEGLVRTGASGTFAFGNRVKHGPQQQSRAIVYPENERLEIRAAEIIPSPEYVVPIFGLEAADDGVIYVIRREWRTFEWDDGSSVPYKLSVTWCPPWARHTVPELLDAWPLPDPRGAARMIADRTGLAVTGGKEAEESRWVLDDGREGPLLYPGERERQHVLAKVVRWWSGNTTLEYTEHAIAGGKVLETELPPS